MYMGLRKVTFECSLKRGRPGEKSKGAMVLTGKEGEGELSHHTKDGNREIINQKYLRISTTDEASAYFLSHPLPYKAHRRSSNFADRIIGL